MAATEVKLSPDHSVSSSASSPESTHGDAPIDNPSNGADGSGAVVQKRKGGRKPVYATQEERKMRNRAAQAAFRERRTEYIKHLEATIKSQEETLSSLQQQARNASEEVLMLRYKNSLLERILAEKQIDVHTELKAFTQSDVAGIGGVPSLPLHPPHVQRALNQRQVIQRTFHNQILQQTPGQPSVQPSQAQTGGQARGSRRAVQQPTPDTQDPKAPQPRQQQSTSQTIQPPVSKRLRRTSDAAFATKDGGVSILPSPSTRGSSPIIASPTLTSPTQFPTTNVTSAFIAPQVGTESAISSFYPSPYQTHMDKLEYDAEAFEGDADQMDTSPTSTHRPEYVLTHRRHQSASALPSTSPQDIGNGIAPNKAGSPLGPDGTPNFFNSNSWTVDLFSDPYIVGQYTNSPFQAFPTSSMR